MNEIKIYLKPSGSLAYLYKDFDLYEGCYRNSQLTVFVPKSLLYENENGTFVNLVKTGAILTAPNGSKLTTKSYYLDYEREQTIGGVEFRVYTTITPKEFCVYAGTQTVVVNVESIDNTNADAQTIISVTTTQTADLIVLESAYLGQDEPIDPTELDKIKATLTEIQSEINEIPNNYVPKASGSNVAYINDQNGGTATKPFAVDVTDNALVARDGNGQIKVPLAPAQDDDAVSKKYVDDADNTKLNKVEPFANGTYAYIVSKDDQFGTTNGYTEISETDKISTIAKRKTNGCIETRTPYADIEAANKGYVDTAISDTQGQLAQTNQNVEDLYTILEQAQVVTVTTLEQAYTTRETADGENIVDGIDTSVKEIRGKTVKTENLIPYPYAYPTVYTNNGVTFTVNNDGAITANGTATGGNALYYLSSLYTVKTPEKSYFSGCPSGGGSTTFSIQAYTREQKYFSDIGSGFLAPANSELNIVLIVANGATANNLVFRPILNAGTEAKPYSKWFAGLKNAFFKEIVSTGKNLIDLSGVSLEKTVNGVTFTKISDGLYRVTGTIADPSQGASPTVNINQGKVYLAGVYSTARYTVDGKDIEFFVSAHSAQSGAPIRNIDGENVTINEDFVIRSAGIYVNRAITGAIDLTVSTILNFGTSALPYEPYISDTLSAATPIELAEYDVAYPETGETKRNSGKKVFDGTETWEARGSAGDLYRYGAVLANVKTSGACVANLSGENSGASVAGNYFIDTEFKVFTNIATVDEWKAHLAEIATAGNPLTVIYETAEATTEATPFDKSKYIAWKNGSETIEQGSTDNSEYGAEDTVKQDYFTLTGGTTNG